MEAGSPDCFLAIFVRSLCLDERGEDGMRPGTLHIHICACDVSILMTLLNEVKHFLFALHVPFYAVLEEGLPLVFSDLELLLCKAVEEVEDSLIVNLDVGTLYLEFYFEHVLAREDCLVVEGFAGTRWLIPRNRGSARSQFLFVSEH